MIALGESNLNKQFYLDLKKFFKSWSEILCFSLLRAFLTSNDLAISLLFFPLEREEEGNEIPLLLLYLCPLGILFN